MRLVNLSIFCVIFLTLVCACNNDTLKPEPNPTPDEPIAVADTLAIDGKLFGDGFYIGEISQEQMDTITDGIIYNSSFRGGYNEWERSNIQIYQHANIQNADGGHAVLQIRHRDFNTNMTCNNTLDAIVRIPVMSPFDNNVEIPISYKAINDSTYRFDGNMNYNNTNIPFFGLIYPKEVILYYTLSDYQPEYLRSCEISKGLKNGTIPRYPYLQSARSVSSMSSVTKDNKITEPSFHIEWKTDWVSQTSSELSCEDIAKLLLKLRVIPLGHLGKYFIDSHLPYAYCSMQDLFANSCESMCILHPQMDHWLRWSSPSSGHEHYDPYEWDSAHFGIKLIDSDSFKIQINPCKMLIPVNTSTYPTNGIKLSHDCEYEPMTAQIQNEDLSRIFIALSDENIDGIKIRYSEYEQILCYSSFEKTDFVATHVRYSFDKQEVAKKFMHAMLSNIAEQPLYRLQLVKELDCMGLSSADKDAIYSFLDNLDAAFAMTTNVTFGFNMYVSDYSYF